MRLTLSDMQRALAARKRPGSGTCFGYLLYGDDIDRIGALRNSLAAFLIADAGGTAAGLVKLDIDAFRQQPERLVENLATPGFLGQAQVTVLGPVVGRDAKAIEAALAYVAPDQALVVSAGSMRRADALVKAFEGSQQAASVPVFRDSAAGDLAPELVAIAATEGFSVRPEAATLAASLVVAQEVGREGLLAQWGLLGRAEAERGEDLSAEAVAALWGEESTQAMAPMIGAIFDADREAGAKAVRDLLAGPFHAVALLRGLQSHLLQLWEARCLRDAAVTEGRSPGAALTRLSFKVFFKEEDRFRARVERWRRPMLHRALMRTLRAEAEIKWHNADPVSAFNEAILPVLEGASSLLKRPADKGAPMARAHVGPG